LQLSTLPTIPLCAFAHSRPCTVIPAHSPLSIPQPYAWFWSRRNGHNPFLFMGFRTLSNTQGVYPLTRHPSPRVFLRSLATPHSPLVPISFRSNTYKTATKQTTLSIFRINTYEKHRGEARLWLISLLPPESTAPMTHLSPVGVMSGTTRKSDRSLRSGRHLGGREKRRDESPQLQRQEREKRRLRRGVGSDFSWRGHAACR